MLEKRREARYPLRLPIKIKCCEGSADSILEAVSRDVSSRGVFVHTREGPRYSLQAKRKVHVEMTLTIGKLKELFGYAKEVKLEVDGFVTRAHEEGVGIEFDKSYSIFPVHGKGIGLRRRRMASK